MKNAANSVTELLDIKIPPSPCIVYVKSAAKSPDLFLKAIEKKSSVIQTKYTRFHVEVLVVIYSSGSRPSAKEGARLTMNVEFCEDNSATSKKMRCFPKNKVGAQVPRAIPMDPPVVKI